MRLNSVLKTCSRTCASFEREPNEASLALDTGAGVRHTPSPEPVRDSGPVRGKSSDGGAGLPIAEVTEVSGKVVIRGVSKSGRKQGWREVQSLSNKHTHTHTHCYHHSQKINTMSYLWRKRLWSVYRRCLGRGDVLWKNAQLIYSIVLLHSQATQLHNTSRIIAKATLANKEQ